MPYTADLETTKDIPTRIWLWAACDIDDDTNVVWGKNVYTFFRWLMSADKVYIHNLKFDGFFIVYHLYKELKYTYNHKKEDSAGTFYTLIGLMGQWYSITINWSEGGKTVIYDSLKKLPMSVSRMAKAFDLPISKGEIDHNETRPIDYEPKDFEIDYVTNDVKIPAAALKLQLAEGQTGMTAGSDALRIYKKTLNGKFRKFFPLIDAQMDRLIRDSYKGGYTYVNELHKGKTLGKGAVYDVNSMYPWAMRDCLLPYGHPKYFTGEYEEDNNYPLYVLKFYCDFSLRPGYHPIVQLKRNPRFMATEYVKDSEGVNLLCMTNVDFELFKEHYEIHAFQALEGYKFKATDGLFDDYINRWMHVKSTTTGGMRELAKLMLNSLYGKFAKNPDTTGKYPILEDDKIRLVKGSDETSDTNYIPVGTFITAYARYKLIRTIQALGDRFVYCDTDSVHILGDGPVDIEVHPSKLGAWKLEDTFTRARFLHAKCYLEEILHDDGSTYLKSTIAGLPESCRAQVNFDNFWPGAVYNGKLKQRSVTGGVILEEIDFTIK